ncbi:NAD(P)/FAD-dependent oxidoreductase [Methanosalsum natronophilum]|uniref:NAD(P)/FAD-dependent oxidoreductase n=1 Tax=Methanosalsum natronophilum TaxID=768733 RepID=A0A3R7XV64_9EURY|nr:NAD(P)/FAD-dependent oxidoreductase [Methanosalsum natronophilum]MCS3923546.1 geranylgeranyl reductase family protein [Methanosalsum natronophilum]RQD87867.1 MAG: NAD(P)/FAD-dependent oxidoreductase [Methanosalsum natronophilum]
MYDIIVVGGGPAGSTAARYASRFGLKTLILDKKKFPRHKTCAGAVSEYAIRNLGIPIPEHLIEKEIVGARVVYGSYSLESIKDGNRAAITVHRDKFDMYLVEQAVEQGATFIDDTAVKELVFNKEYVEVHTLNKIYHAKIIIGADGVNGVCSKYVRESLSVQEKAFSIEAHVPTKSFPIKDRRTDVVEFHFGDVDKGYGWIFPKKDFFCIGIGEIGNSAENPLTFYKRFSSKLGLEYVKPRGHSIPVGGYKRKTYNDKILLTGDAAGFVDAFLGEGIAYAIISGKIAAETAKDAINENDVTCKQLVKYHTNCNKSFGKNLKYSLILSKLFYQSPKTFALMLVQNPPLLEKFVLLATNEYSYSSYIKWLIPRIPYYKAKQLINKAN